jgi:DNA-binding PadR family transcriptional regulator
MDTRTICLGVLSWGEATGYEIRKCIREDFASFIEVSHGAIYPALADLHRRGLVSCKAVRQSGKPDKKVYRITAAGRQALREGLMASSGRHRVRSEFVALLVFAEHQPLERVAELIDQRIAGYRELAERVQPAAESAETGAGARFAAGFGAALARAGIRYLQENREWLEAELAAETEAAAIGEQR